MSRPKLNASARLSFKTNVSTTGCAIHITNMSWFKLSQPFGQRFVVMHASTCHLGFRIELWWAWSNNHSEAGTQLSDWVDSPKDSQKGEYWWTLYVPSGGINGAITPHSSFNLASTRTIHLAKTEKIETRQARFLPSRLYIGSAWKTKIQCSLKSSRKKLQKEKSLSKHKRLATMNNSMKLV